MHDLLSRDYSLVFSNTGHAVSRTEKGPELSLEIIMGYLIQTGPESSLK